MVVSDCERDRTQQVSSPDYMKEQQTRNARRGGATLTVTPVGLEAVFSVTSPTDATTPVSTAPAPTRPTAFPRRHRLTGHYRSRD